MPAAKAPGEESIEERPEMVEQREEPLHWEMGSVLSARGKGYPVFQH